VSVPSVFFVQARIDPILPAVWFNWDQRRIATVSDVIFYERGASRLNRKDRSTQPHMLLRLATTLVSQAVSAAVSQVIDIATLHSGLSYFSQPLLSWCLSGILKWLCSEIQRQGYVARKTNRPSPTLIASFLTECLRQSIWM
jgi:hypothetical protein